MAEPKLRSKAKGKRNRGVVLLIIVTLMTLFMMIGITLSLLAMNYKDSGEQLRSAGTYGDLPERESDFALNQILFGTSQLSALRGHSILEDLYGIDSYQGTVQSTPTVLNGGQALQINVPIGATPPPPQPETILDHYSGRVITFLTGDAAGLSTRVLAWYPDPTNPTGMWRLVIETPASDLPVSLSVATNDQYLINGAPFNGTGAGYTASTTYNLDAMANFPDGNGNTVSYPVALLPNYSGYWQMPAENPNLGGMDESYDAADYQDVWMSMVPPDLGQGTGLGQITLLPSYHRPDLVSFWFNFLENDAAWLGSSLATPRQKRLMLRHLWGPDGIRDNADDDTWVARSDVSTQKRDAILALKRAFIFRPLHEDHPSFTGTSPSFEPDLLHTYDSSGTPIAPAPFDVDNDGDGIADSIWVDLGLPIVTARDGRKYKRLAAILIKDLDNRIDVNAVGNAFIAANANAQASTPLSNFAVAGTDVNAPTPVTVSRGLGFGPGEHVFSHLFSTAAAYNQLLGRRYGNDNVPGAAGDDFHSRVMTIGIPDDHLNQYSSYTTPPDVWGRGALALDYFGTPAWWDQTQMGSAERVDDPYEVQFDARRSRADAPYTIAEMEPLLRYHDRDMRGMQSRLMLGALGNDLASSPPGSLGPDHVRRAMLTTRSASLPVPQMVVPPELRDETEFSGITSLSVMQYVSRRLPATVNKTDELREMLPFEIRHGRLFNINREFGNGVHDAMVMSAGGVPPTYNFPEDPLGVVDDPGESYRDLMNFPSNDPREKIWSNQINLEHENPELPPVVTTTYPVVPGYPAATIRVDPRQLMARHLYCLAMFLRDQTSANSNYDYYADGANAPGPDPEMSRMIAQWAVNAVDFRDADSINTGFEYDVNPLDGWAVDGDLSTPDRGTASAPIGDIVWGVERPELLISEVNAWHDRRTTDETTETPDMTEMAADVAGGDDDFDQRLVPRGAVFFELFNPWVDRSGGSYDHKRPEFNNGAGPQNGIELHRVNNGGSPVWRLLIVKDSLVTTDADPDFDTDPDAAAAPNSGPEHWTRNPPATPEDIERSVYFVLPPAINTALTAMPNSGHGDPFFLPPSVADPNNPMQPLLSPLLAGRYAVIGGFDAEVPQGAGLPPHYISWAGRKNDGVAIEGALDLANTRRIELRPQNNINTPQFYVLDNSAAGVNDFDTADVQNTIAIPIQDLSVSEPPPSSPTPYPPATAATAPEATYFPSGEPAYMPPIDTPLDTDSALQQNRTTSRYRRVFLQRLANPLLAWDATVNPYVTVDASDIDLTAFNGAAVDAADPNVGMGNFRSFQTFQRGGPFPDIEVPGYTYNLSGNRGYRNLWANQEPYGALAQNSPAEPATVGPHFFPRQLFHTLGYLNRRFWPFYTTTGNNGMPTIPPPMIPQYGQYVGAPGPIDGEDMQPRTFPWLTHLDRPYTSPMELLMVPVTSQSQLLMDFNMASVNTATNFAYDRPYPNYRFAHLANFFHSRNGTGAAEGPGLYRIFDFLEVPSPYAETERVYNPDFFSTASYAMNAANGAIPTYRPPFSRQTHFSDPGKININTIYDARVWEALVNQYPEFDPSNIPNGQAHFIRLMLSRQGFGSQQTDLLLHSSFLDYPSIFSNPFRTANAADLAPPTPSNPNLLRRIGPDATLLRSDPNDPSAPGIKPLMVRDAISTTPAAHDDPTRNPYFRYQGLQKVASSLTTHSNVFAIWVTVGYFEVEENRSGAGGAVVVDAGHPDGYRLGQEVGGDVGQIRRSRMFYIVDRSIPVAFENGKRHNTDKAVLLRRFIE